MAYTLVLRGFPKLVPEQSSDHEANLGRPVGGHPPRLWQRPGVVLHSVASVGELPETFGLGAALVVMGPSVLSGCILVPDHLGRRDSRGHAQLKAWARERPLATTLGPRPWRLATLREYFDPCARAEKEPAKPWAFQPTAYEGAGFVVGADLGRLFGLVAEHIVVPRRRAGAWQLWLPGWGVRGKASNVRQRSPHRPCLYVRARRVGWAAGWGPCSSDRDGKPAGKRDRDGKHWQGLFVDVLSLAYALSADRGASFAEQCENFGVEADELPLAVNADERGAEAVTRAALCVHRLAVRLDEVAGQWFTTARERREGHGRLDLARTASPGVLAGQFLDLTGLDRPLRHFDLSHTELERWAEASHGGWCKAG